MHTTEKSSYTGAGSADRRLAGGAASASCCAEARTVITCPRAPCRASRAHALRRRRHCCEQVKILCE
eukprot:3541470-Prymnesium_polylepis.1